MKIKNFFGHLSTIRRHKRLVRKFCFKSGLYGQGIRHDWSKYSPTEFRSGVKYFQGDRSPNDIERRTDGYSKAWLHHQGRNRHHWEYWMDYIPGVGYGTVAMPPRYTAEMACDRIAACMVYNKEKYTSGDALSYFRNSKTVPKMMHPDTAALLTKLLTMAAENGESAMFKYIRENIAGKKD